MKTLLISLPAFFTYSMFNYFVCRIDEKLRMSMHNVFYPIDGNIGDYPKMIEHTGEGGTDDDI
ncbi:MAG: hypothetical protein JW770_03705 [Actinobacteria bacterium]|nr:hypothetical protein [Actinomycetota bacterium]